MLRVGKRRLGIVLSAAVLAGLACWRPVSWVSLGTLEWWYHAYPGPAGQEAGAIVVLSGGDVRVRYEHAARLYGEKRLPVLASVGRGDSPVAAAHCAALARRILHEAGVPESMIWIEARSANTYEDAKYAAEALHRKGVRKVLLVTEAYHTLRANLCFRKQGLDVAPAPCGRRSAILVSAPSDLLPRKKFVRENLDALHEWAGIAWYFLKGYV
jgi:uncharacterized SAM-binding protein YcdF (DUF218 family)